MTLLNKCSLKRFRQVWEDISAKERHRSPLRSKSCRKDDYSFELFQKGYCGRVRHPVIHVTGQTNYTTVYTQLQFTYLLSQWSRVLLEKLTGSQLVKKFPSFYGTR